MANRGPACIECGVDWFRHGGLDHEFANGSADPNPTTSEWRVVDSYSTGGGVHDSWRALGPWRATEDEARRDAAAEARVKELECEHQRKLAEWADAVQAVNASKAELIREIEEAVDADVFAHLPIDPDGIYEILDKHRGQP